MSQLSQPSSASSKILIAISFVTVAGVLTLFQNCASPKMDFQEMKLGSLGVCEGVSCDLLPLTMKPAVTTILMALGDEADDQLVVNGASAQLVAETVIRYTSPSESPKILVIRDSGSGTESSVDTTYVTDVLLKRYNVTVVQDPVGGLSLKDISGYDVVWLNNPGAPMGSINTRDALMAFPGGVVIQGDDLSRGGNFDLKDLTGLEYIDNGASVVCAGTIYNHDNNSGYQYTVNLDPAKIPGAKDATITFKYGNDIDNTSPARADLEILARAKGGGPSCTEERPAIVRYLKK